ncbi:MAG: hypothetical protein PHG00_15390 [Methylococcales bacterium]|nr:hypothetical protein [Methylococcales bacterium]
MLEQINELPLAYLPHPIAEVLPLMADDEYSEWKADIQEHGLLLPIILCTRAGFWTGATVLKPAWRWVPSLKRLSTLASGIDFHEPEPEQVKFNQVSAQHGRG